MKKALSAALAAVVGSTVSITAMAEFDSMIKEIDHTSDGPAPVVMAVTGNVVNCTTAPSISYKPQRTTAPDPIYDIVVPIAPDPMPAPEPDEPTITNEPNIKVPHMDIKEEIICGDIDGDKKITAKDAAYILMAINNGEMLDPTVADFNEDGEVTALDAECILKYLVGLGM